MSGVRYTKENLDDIMQLIECHKSEFTEFKYIQMCNLLKSVNDIQCNNTLINGINNNDREDLPNIQEILPIILQESQRLLIIMEESRLYETVALLGRMPPYVLIPLNMICFVMYNSMYMIGFIVYNVIWFIHLKIQQVRNNLHSE
tara:strand:+ start:494 stop:928 length:435 start_codon:yes stop_codon:yes gene_type:complete